MSQNQNGGKARKPRLIMPSDKFYAEGDEPLNVNDIVDTMVVRPGQFINTLLQALIVLVIAVFLGLVLNNIFKSNAYEIPLILDSVTDIASTKMDVVFATVIAGVAALYVFLPKELPDSVGNHSADRRVTRLLAALVGIVLIDMRLFNIDLAYILNLPQAFDQSLLSILIGQLATIIVIGVLLVILGIRINTSITIVKNLPNGMRETVSWLWFLAVSLFLAVFSGRYTEDLVVPYFGRIYIAQLPSPLAEYLEEAPLTLLTATALSLAVGSIIYAPPEHRGLNRKFITLRMLFLIGSLVAAGWAYQLMPNSEQFIFTAVIAIVLAISLVFVQRAAS